MTSKNNRASPLCHFKLCASLRSHMWIQTAITVRKRSVRVKIVDFAARATYKYDGWPWKTIGHLSYATSSFMYHSVAICEFWSYGPETPKLRQILFWSLWPRPLISDLDLSYKDHFCQWQSLLKISRWYDERNIMNKDVTDRQTDRQKHCYSCLAAAKGLASLIINMTKSPPSPVLCFNIEFVWHSDSQEDALQQIVT